MIGSYFPHHLSGCNSKTKTDKDISITTCATSYFFLWKQCGLLYTTTNSPRKYIRMWACVSETTTNSFRLNLLFHSSKLQMEQRINIKLGTHAYYIISTTTRSNFVYYKVWEANKTQAAVFESVMPGGAKHILGCSSKTCNEAVRRDMGLDTLPGRRDKN